MLRFAVTLCLIVGSLGQWVNPDWLRSSGGSNQGYKRFPPLPGSIPLDGDRPAPSLMYLADEPSTTPSTSTGTPDVRTTTAPRTTGRPDASTSTATVSPTPSSTVGPTPAPTPGSCPAIFSCADCNTAQICRPSANGLIPAMKVPCPKTAPYCDYTSGTCNTEPDYAHCGNPDQFVCMDNGYFPDPSNCSVYHVCNDYSSQKFFCVSGHVYNPDEMKCTSPAKYSCNTVNCETVNTDTDTGIKEIIGNTHYYAYCNQGQPQVVDRCPQEYKLNVTSQVCEALCESDGLMRDVSNCLNFYKCYTIYINETTPYMVRQNLPCPSNEAFDPNSYQCVPKSLTDCKQ